MSEKRFRLIVAYDGSHYMGSQYQKDVPTVQGMLETALSTIMKQGVRIITAGRTDTGVHALGQVASFEANTGMVPEEVERALNSILPQDICILRVDYAQDAFHPRYSALLRHYLYLVVHNNLPFYRNYSYYLPKWLNIESIGDAIDIFYGLSDFSALCVQEERDKKAKITKISASNFGVFTAFRVSAPFFLRRMVRMMVGALIEVGLGRLNLDELINILESGDPSGIVPLPPNGLYLARVDYPDGFSADVNSVFGIPIDF